MERTRTTSLLPLPATHVRGHVRTIHYTPLTTDTERKKFTAIQSLFVRTFFQAYKSTIMYGFIGRILCPALFKIPQRDGQSLLTARI